MLAKHVQRKLTVNCSIDTTAHVQLVSISIGHRGGDDTLYASTKLLRIYFKRIVTGFISIHEWSPMVPHLQHKCNTAISLICFIIFLTRPLT